VSALSLHIESTDSMIHMQRKFIRTSKKAKQRGRLWSHFQKYLESTPELSESAWEKIMEEDRDTYEGT